MMDYDANPSFVGITVLLETTLSGGGLKCRSRLYKDMLKIVRLKIVF